MYVVRPILTQLPWRQVSRLLVFPYIKLEPNPACLPRACPLHTPSRAPLPRAAPPLCASPRAPIPLAFTPSYVLAYLHLYFLHFLFLSCISFISFTFSSSAFSERVLRPSAEPLNSALSPLGGETRPHPGPPTPTARAAIPLVSSLLYNLSSPVSN